MTQDFCCEKSLFLQLRLSVHFAVLLLDYIFHSVNVHYAVEIILALICVFTETVIIVFLFLIIEN